MDKQAFEAEVMRMEASLYGVARTFFASPHDCADAVQEAVLRAWKNRHALRHRAYFGTWITRILINQCKTMHAQRARTLPMADVPEPPPEDADPLLYESVMALDLKYRLPFILHVVEGYSIREVAALMRLPQGTIMSRVHRARNKLKASWREEAYRHET